MVAGTVATAGLSDFRFRVNPPVGAACEISTQVYRTEVVKGNVMVLG